MPTTTSQLFAHRLLNGLDEASLRTDAGVQAVITYLAAYPGQFITDIASATGFTDSAVANYISALGLLVENKDDTYRLSDAGSTLIEHAVTEAPIAPSKRSSSSLTAAQLTRWAEIKTIVMDTPELIGSAIVNPTQREQMTLFFEVLDGVRTATADEALDMNIHFANQGIQGISLHRPGTSPAFYFNNLANSYESLDDSDEEIIELALRAGLTFW